MREIKFRAWIEPKGADFRAMANVSSIDFETRKIVVTFNNPYFAQTKFEFGDGDYTLMQSTELKDKNGKEIYEGDIVDYMSMIFEIINHRQAYGWNEDNEFIPFANMAPCQLPKIEVIGNIYKNPELLEVSL